MGKAAIAVAIVLVIFAVLGGLFYYSYTQIQVDLNDVKFHSIDWTTFSWSTLFNLGLNVLTGNWLGAAFELIDGINLNLIFGVSNNGFFPVYIPDLSYDIFVNDVHVSNGYTYLDATIFPGETKQITAFQNFKKSSLTPAISSIVSKGGIMEIKVKGTAYFDLIVLKIPIPFESSKTISIQNEIRNKINAEIQKHEEEERRKAAAIAAAAAAASKAAAQAAVNTVSAVGNTVYNIVKSLEEQLFGSPYDLDLDLPGQIIIDSEAQVYAGNYHYFSRTFQCTVKLQGGFIASAALGDNIKVFIVDEQDYNLYKNNKPFRSYYSSGKVESGVFDITLSSGKYYIVLSNNYSSFSTKNVQIQASAYCV